MHGERLRLVAGEPVRGFEKRRGLAFERQQIQVLLNPRTNGCRTPTRQFAPQELNRLGAPALCCRRLRLDFDRRTERRGQACIGIELAVRQVVETELADFLGAAFGGGVVPCSQFAAAEPGESFDVFRRYAHRVAILLQYCLRGAEIAGKHGLMRLVNNYWHLGRKGLGTDQGQDQNRETHNGTISV